MVVLRLFCGYALHNGRNFEEKQCVDDELRNMWNMYVVDELVVCLGMW